MFKSNFNFEANSIDNYLKINFSGDFDKIAIHENKLQINKIINEFKGKTVVLDFENLKYINSEAIGYLMQLNGFLLSVDKKLVLCSVNKNVKDILDAIGIFEIIPAFKNFEDFLNTNK